MSSIPKPICGHCQDMVDQGVTYVDGSGPTPAKYLLVGEAPGATEDKVGKPFVGKTGQMLREALRDLGVDSKEVYITNTVRCRPDNKNSTPGMDWVRDCRDVCMARTLALVDPEVIICIGGPALKCFTDDGNIALERNRHKVYRYRHCYNCGQFADPEVDSCCTEPDIVFLPVVATWHPSAVARRQGYSTIEDWWLNDLHSYLIEDSWERVGNIFDVGYTVAHSIPYPARKANEVIYDVETTGLKPWNGDELRCFGVAPLLSGRPTIVTEDDQHPGQMEVEARALLMDPDKILVGANIMFDMMWGLRDQEIPRAKGDDVQFLHYLVDDEYPVRSLKHLFLLYTDYEQFGLEDGGVESPLDEVIPYNAQDIQSTRLVRQGVVKELNDAGVRWEKPNELMRRLLPVLAGMSVTGIPVDRAVLEGIKDTEKEKYLASAEGMEKLWRVRPLNYCRSCEKSEYDCDCSEPELFVSEWDLSVLRRYHDLSDFMFKKLQIEPPNMSDLHRKDGRVSTRKEVLQAIQAEGKDETGWIDALFEYRSVHENYKKYVLDVYNRTGEDGRIHPRYHHIRRARGSKQQGTKTGRLSVTKPAVHNIPNGHPMREAFIPLPGHTHLVQVDLSQIELAILAQLSRDPELIDVIRDGEDIHQWMADTATESGYPMSRKEAKTVNFGILYGISKYGLAARSRFDEQAASTFIRLWFNRFSTVRAYKEEVEYRALNQGWVETPYGHRQYYPLGIHPRTSDGGSIKRRAFNFRIQKMANDLNMLILCDWCDRFLSEGFPLTTIHDAIILSTDQPEDTLDTMAGYYERDLQESFEDFLGEELVVPIRAEASVGENWGSMEEDVAEFST